MTCHNGRPGPDHQGDCYKWLKAITNFTNTADWWVVMVGSDFTAASATTTMFSALDAQGVTVDSFKVINVSAAGFAEEGMPRKMLIPPGGQGVVNPGNTVAISLIQCATLDHAIDML